MSPPRVPRMKTLPRTSSCPWWPHRRRRTEAHLRSNGPTLPRRPRRDPSPQDSRRPTARPEASGTRPYSGGSADLPQLSGPTSWPFSNNGDSSMRHRGRRQRHMLWTTTTGVHLCGQAKIPPKSRSLTAVPATCHQGSAERRLLVVPNTKRLRDWSRWSCPMRPVGTMCTRAHWLRILPFIFFCDGGSCHLEQQAASLIVLVRFVPWHSSSRATAFESRPQPLRKDGLPHHELFRDYVRRPSIKLIFHESP